MPRGKPRQKLHLTARTVANLATDDPRGERFYDEALAGFGVVVYPSGRRSYFLEWGSPRRRRMTLGPHGVLTPDAARKQARITLGEVLQGRDPLQERKRPRVTLGEWVAEWLEGFRARRKPRTVTEYTRYLEDAAERWGSLPLADLTVTDVRAGVKAAQERGTTTANRWLAALRSCLSDAVTEGLIPRNPAAHVKPLRENEPRARVLADEELARLLAALEKEEDVFARAALRMLVETGARLREVLTARWEDLDLEAAVWRIASPKAGFPQVIPIPASVAAMLRDLPRVGPFVIAGRFPDRPRYDLRGAWDRACALAGLEDVHIHDLRRTFGLAVSRTAGLHTASKLLRHSDVRVTARVYAPLGLEDMRAGLERRQLPAVKREDEGSDDGHHDAP